MSIETFLLYLSTWSLVALTPGPAVMCAMSQATRYGFRHALAGVAGIQLAHFVFFGCVGFGLAALLATATTAFTVLRIVGAAYLLYLGGSVLVATFRPEAAGLVASTPPRRRNLLLQGFAIQITNPKALLFMSALLPQFIQPELGLPPQLAILLATTIVVDAMVQIAYAYFASQGAQSLRTSGVSLWLERAFGAALVLFGVRLLAAGWQMKTAPKRGAGILAPWAW
jgi:threonine/homoserine/homoserine lactone efflux protein